MIPSFAHLGLSSKLLDTIQRQGFDSPTEIQSRVVPKFLLSHNICACAQTGSGKTASFLWPLLDKLTYMRKRTGLPRAIVLSPTRELAQQVFENFKIFSQGLSLKAAILVGGEWAGEQERALRQKPDVIIATPGRLLDLLERERFMPIDVSTLIIDEADRMLDMGFMPDVERLLKVLPTHKQTILISATYPEALRSQIDALVPNATHIQAQVSATPVQTIAQHCVALSYDILPKELRTDRHAQKKETKELRKHAAKDAPPPLSPKAQDMYDLKRMALRSIVRQHEGMSAIVFCNTKRDVDIVAKSLNVHGLKAMPIHGDLTQSVRNETLDLFRRDKGWILVASDVAARGIDIDDLPLVINFDVPMNAEDYIHRIGRTGRAGKSGIAYSLIEVGYKKDQERLANILSMMGVDQIPPYTVDLSDEFQKRLDKKASSSKSAKQESGSRRFSGDRDGVVGAMDQPSSARGFGVFIPSFILHDPADYFARSLSKAKVKAKAKKKHPLMESDQDSLDVEAVPPLHLNDMMQPMACA